MLCSWLPLRGNYAEIARALGDNPAIKERRIKYANDPQNILKSTFGYDTFRHHQAEIIAALNSGRDAFALMPTGGGKSVCYQIPALIRDGAGIVISPLIALMQDQVDALRQLGIRAEFLNSTQTSSEQRAVEQALKAGKLDLLYMAPERLLSAATLSLIEHANIALFAIDEAHCVAQWGHDFRKEYQQLSMLHTRFPNIPRIALTATADARTRSEIIEQLSLQQAEVFINSFDRPNIHYTINESGRDGMWRFLCEHHASDAGIVYCLSRKQVEATALWLSEKGRTALPYHAGLNQSVRKKHQQRFLREDGLIIVATIAFGMGIDKPDVRFVAHLNLPKNIESYYQETGRAGRDGLAADAWMSFGLKDIINLRLFTEQSDASEQHKRIMLQKTDAMLGLCEITTCRRQAMLAYFGEKIADACGNCDNCIDPPSTWDATTAAQKALSCVYRSGQRFGVQYLTHILTGKDDERIKSNGHDQLSTFNIGAEHSAIEWRDIFRQLIAHGYLVSDNEGYGVLKLATKSRTLLTRDCTQTVMLRALRRKKTTPARKRKNSGMAELVAADQPLFEALRELRTRLAKEQGVPPYVIFADKTLREMAAVKPSNKAQMLGISGIGETKLARYGDDFQEVIHQAS